MASLPARRPSQQRRASRPDLHTQTPSQSSHSPVRSRSEDSQTIFVKTPEDGQHQETDTDQPFSNAAAAASSAPLASADDDPSVKKCWICFSDSTEDTPETSPWRDPCPCALVAHEECLLDWIADMEAPKNNRNGGLVAPKIECPQCKGEIKLARPRDYIVDAVRGLERMSGRVVLSGSFLAVTGALTHISMSIGTHSIFAIFGAEDGGRIFLPHIIEASQRFIEIDVNNPGAGWQQISALLLTRLKHWRLYFGLPLIGPILILSRTSLADSVLPVLPIVFFASQAHSPNDALDLPQWPPSASLAFSLLPYARAMYNACYKSIWEEREKRWLKEIQPRVGQAEQDDQAGDDAPPAAQDLPPADAENIFEVEIEGGIWGAWDDEEEDRPFIPNDQQPADPIAVMPIQDADDQAAAPPPNILDNRDQNPNQNQDPNQRRQRQQPPIGGERHLSFSPTGIAETVLGALAFPTIAGLSGEFLKLLLPRAWTLPHRSKGFFAQKWARSLVGGCLFVVCKDAILLYVRWRMAQIHRGRRVVDFERSTRRR